MQQHAGQSVHAAPTGQLSDPADGQQHVEPLLKAVPTERHSTQHEALQTDPAASDPRERRHLTFTGAEVRALMAIFDASPNQLSLPDRMRFYRAIRTARSPRTATPRGRLGDYHAQVALLRAEMEQAMLEMPTAARRLSLSVALAQAYQTAERPSTLGMQGSSDNQAVEIQGQQSLEGKSPIQGMIDIVS